MKAKISEIFYSFQGEGKFLGVPQIFIRFYGCNMKCSWCDTPQRAVDKRKKLYKEYTKSDLIRAILRNKRSLHSISLTGGEPLVQKDFLKIVLPALKKKRYQIYLETNGTLPKAFNEVVDFVDIIAMDIKLPSSTGQVICWNDQKKFLKIASKKNVFLKMIISKKTKTKDLTTASKLASEVNRDIVCILQPNTQELKTGAIERCFEAQKICSKFLRDVRIIPQVHKLIGVR